LALTDLAVSLHALSASFSKLVVGFRNAEARHSKQEAWIDAVALIHSPLSMQDAAHLRDASGPLPVRTISRMPSMMSSDFLSEMPAGLTLGQTSTHLPHRVQASSISSTRSPRAVSKDLPWILTGLLPLTARILLLLTRLLAAALLLLTGFLARVLVGASVQSVRAPAGFGLNILGSYLERFRSRKAVYGGSLGVNAQAGAMLTLRRNPEICNRLLHVQTAYHRMPFGRSVIESNVIALFMLQQRRRRGPFFAALRHALTGEPKRSILFRRCKGRASSKARHVPSLAARMGNRASSGLMPSPASHRLGCSAE
jgi:hypothetical protein